MTRNGIMHLANRLRTPAYPGREYDVHIAQDALTWRKACLDEARQKAPELLQHPVFLSLAEQERALIEVIYEGREEGR